MFFKKDKKVSKGLKKVDTLITGLVLGGILASVYGIKKYEDSKKVDDIEQRIEKQDKEKRKGFFSFGKQKEEKKDGVLKIILRIIIKKILGRK